VAEASATCNTTCPGGATLSCCTQGTCSTTNGVSVNCNGTLMSCSAADLYRTCRNNCFAARSACLANCGLTQPCGQHCNSQFNTCLAACGPVPVTNIGC
jgi:hypothetical protein